VSDSEKPRHIAQCLELAILLEVSANKPGNVNLTSSFEGTTCQHFLASAVASASSFQEAAYRGMLVAAGKLDVGDVGLGNLIKTCTREVNDWQGGGNTILGTIMLFIPLAVAAGMVPYSKHNELDLVFLRRNIDLLVKSTGAWDSVHLYEAIGIANPNGLNKTNELDVNDSLSKERLIKENITLFDVFRLATNWDDICYEWVNNYTLTFDFAYPYLIEQLRSKSLNTAVVHTFLKILSERPDSFIVRKLGKKTAQNVSAEAKTVLEVGGMDTAEGRKSLKAFDKRLREQKNKCNPGTTADLTASALALCTLKGYRP